MRYFHQKCKLHLLEIAVFFAYLEKTTHCCSAPTAKVGILYTQWRCPVCLFVRSSVTWNAYLLGSGQQYWQPWLATALLSQSGRHTDGTAALSRRPFRPHGLLWCETQLTLNSATESRTGVPLQSIRLISFPHAPHYN